MLKVKPGSIAERAGLQEEDIILEINGNRINGMRSKQIGDLLRSREEITLVVKPADSDNFNDDRNDRKERPTVKFMMNDDENRSRDQVVDDSDEPEPLYDSRPKAVFARNFRANRQAPMEQEPEQEQMRELRFFRDFFLTKILVFIIYY